MTEFVSRKEHLGDLGVGRIIITKWILGKEVNMLTGFNWLRV
jgi:hypothetical protein